MLQYSAAMLSKSLSGIRIVDLSRLFPGPLSTLMLADMGAEVIKIEAPEGEMGRYLPPYQFGSSAGFLQLNRAKRSLTLNLKKPQGAMILRKLLENSDVLVESFRPGVMKRFGADYDTLKNEFPRLIYCSISGYGQSGPLSKRPGHDLNYISIAGLLSLTGNTKKGYLIPPVQIADVIGAFQATTAITAALLQRFRSGKGQYLDISLMNGALFTLIGLAATHFAGVEVEAKSLPLAGQLACYNVYRTADDGYLAIALLEPKFWQTFCLKMGLGEFFHNQLQSDQPELIEALSKRFEEKSLNEWLDFFQNEDVCITPVKNFEEAMNDLHSESNKMILNVDYPSGTLSHMKTPFVATADHNIRAPLLGEHNVEILTELGFSPDEIASLKTEGVL